MIVASLVVVVAAHAIALEPGETCKLKAPLSVTIRRAGGIVESPLDVGTEVQLISVGDGGNARIAAGEVKGTVSDADLESACSGTLRACTLSSAVMMYEQNRSDSKSWRIKPGADVSILKRGKTWAAVRVGDLQGFVKTDEITPACAQNGASASDDGDSGSGNGSSTSAPSTESVDRGDGPGVLLLPFTLEGAAPAGQADAFFDILFEHTQYYRPDAARLQADAKFRDLAWKESVQAAAKRAQGVEVAYVVVGRMQVEAPKPDAPLEERYLLQLALVDAKTGHVLKGVRVRPSTRAADPWAEKVLADLLPAMAAAPGSKLPTVKTQLELPAQKEEPVAPKATTTIPEAAPTPWFANGWGYATLAATALCGAGSGLAGTLAIDDDHTANGLVQADPSRASLRNKALAEAITADSLGAAAAGAFVATIVVFATRSGLD